MVLLPLLRRVVVGRLIQVLRSWNFVDLPAYLWNPSRVRTRQVIDKNSCSNHEDHYDKSSPLASDASVGGIRFGSFLGDFFISGNLLWFGCWLIGGRVCVGELLLAGVGFLWADFELVGKECGFVGCGHILLCSLKYTCFIYSWLMLLDFLLVIKG